MNLIYVMVWICLFVCYLFFLSNSSFDFSSAVFPVCWFPDTRLLSVSLFFIFVFDWICRTFLGQGQFRVLRDLYFWTMAILPEIGRFYDLCRTTEYKWLDAIFFLVLLCN